MASLPRRSPQPPARSRRGHLRLVRGGGALRDDKPAPRAKRPELRFAAAAAAVVAAFVFGLVLLHVLLAQSAFRLQTLQKQVAEEQTRNRLMRYSVATSESPARVADAAGGIGLVIPAQQRQLVVQQPPMGSKPGSR